MKRTTTIFIATLLISALVPGVASAEPNEDGIYPMIFPVQGENRYSDTFGAARGGGRSHAGQDIMADKGVPVVAVADGVVRWIGSTCCYLAIEHDDGWESWYIHLNNDTQLPDGTFTDDGLGQGIADGIERGVRVSAGQLIGWVGDSGNAEWVSPHLHFELRDPDGVPYNAYQSLLAAHPLPPQDPPCPEGADCDTVAFQDDSGRFHLWSSLDYPNEVDDFYFGFPGDIPFSGDWDCDGIQTPGLYRQSDGYVYLRNSNTQGVADISFFFGIAGDYPVAGDFDGDGCDSVSIYRPSEAKFYIINQVGSNDGGLGAADYSFYFGVQGDKPFVGDFDGDGVDTIGLHRESTGLVYFRNANVSSVADFEFVYGIPNDMLVAGDWDGDGLDTVGVYRPSTGMFYIRNSNTSGLADATFSAGARTGVVALKP